MASVARISLRPTQDFRLSSSRQDEDFPDAYSEGNYCYRVGQKFCSAILRVTPWCNGVDQCNRALFRHLGDRAGFKHPGAGSRTFCTAQSAPGTRRIWNGPTARAFRGCSVVAHRRLVTSRRRAVARLEHGAQAGHQVAGDAAGRGESGRWGHRF